MRAILTYHSIDASGSVISTAPDGFRRQMEWLASSGIRVVGVEELLALPDATDAVSLTFDDGFANFASVAWPVLRTHGFPATVFVVSDRIGGTSDWNAGEPGLPELPLMGWDTLGRLAGEGVQIGSHGATHVPLDEVDGDRLRREVCESARVLSERLGRPPRAFAYPYGRHGSGCVRLVRETYDWAAGTRFRILGSGDDPYELPRLDVHYFRRPGSLESWGSPAFRRRIWMRRQGRRIQRALPGGR